MLSRLPILLAEIQAGNNSKQLKKRSETINLQFVHFKTTKQKVVQHFN